MRNNTLGESLDSTRFHNLKKYKQHDAGIKFLERAINNCTNPEQDPRYIETLEYLTHFLLRSGNLIVADQTFEKIKNKVKPDDFSPMSHELSQRIQAGFSGITRSFNKGDTQPTHTAVNPATKIIIKKRRTFTLPDKDTKPEPEI